MKMAKKEEEKQTETKVQEEKKEEGSKNQSSKKEKQVTCTYLGKYKAIESSHARLKQGIPGSVPESYFKKLKKQYGSDIIEGAPKKK